MLPVLREKRKKERKGKKQPPTVACDNHNTEKLYSPFCSKLVFLFSKILGVSFYRDA